MKISRIDIDYMINRISRVHAVANADARLKYMQKANHSNADVKCSYPSHSLFQHYVVSIRQNFTRKSSPHGPLHRSTSTFHQNYFKPSTIPTSLHSISQPFSYTID